MIEQRKVGPFVLRAKAVPHEGGFLGAVIVTEEGRSDTDPAKVILARHGVADGFVFADAKAAMRYAFEIGHREVRRAKSSFIGRLFKSTL